MPQYQFQMLYIGSVFVTAETQAEARALLDRTLPRNCDLALRQDMVEPAENVSISWELSPLVYLRDPVGVEDDEDETDPDGGERKAA